MLNVSSHANEPTEDWYWEEAEGDREGNAIDGPVMVRGFGTFGGGEGGRKTQADRGFDHWQVRRTSNSYSAMMIATLSRSVAIFLLASDSASRGRTN
jgi:hypothetical protein